MSVAEIMKQVSVTWSKLKPEQKVAYEEMSKKDKRRYDEQMEEFLKKKQEE